MLFAATDFHYTMWSYVGIVQLARLTSCMIHKMTNNCIFSFLVSCSMYFGGDALQGTDHLLDYSVNCLAVYVCPLCLATGIVCVTCNT